MSLAVFLAAGGGGGGGGGGEGARNRDGKGTQNACRLSHLQFERPSGGLVEIGVQGSDKSMLLTSLTYMYQVAVEVNSRGAGQIER